MGDMGDFFRDWDEMKKKKKASNKSSSTKMLTDKGIEFESKNNGAHLVVSYNGNIADFWPSTGKFNIRGEPGYYRGVKNLIKRLEADYD